jgi:hypothetical protein
MMAIGRPSRLTGRVAWEIGPMGERSPVIDLLLEEAPFLERGEYMRMVWGTGEDGTGTAAQHELAASDFFVAADDLGELFRLTSAGRSAIDGAK